MSFSQNNHTTPKCKNVTNERIRKNCITTEIQEYVDTNYNTSAVAAFAKPGINRIYSRFRINEIGKIVDIQVKGSAPELEIEAIRTLESFPNMISTKDSDDETTKNKTFEDTYTLPITFQVTMIEIDLSQPQGRITDN